ncbi:MAG: tetratricopeptide repeat protein [Acidobacteria bacterium]|nr:tetratricopeptide repeat protein [Acidobacteriota bacterium]
MDRPSLHGGYSTREVAALLDMSEAQIRSCARAGFVAPQIGPRGELLFSFQDLVLLRTARALLAARIPRRRIRIALQNLHAQLPKGQPLTAVRISAQGHHVVARDGGEAWHPESGQTLLDFEVADLAREAGAFEPRRPAPPAGLAPIVPVPAAGDRQDQRPRRPTAGSGSSPFPWAAASGAPPPTAAASGAAGPSLVSGSAASSGPPVSAADCYELAVALEADDPAAAEAAYRQALAIDPDLADAHLNLGRLLHEGGDPAAAEAHYRKALAVDPDDALAAYNLGVALQDQRRPREAAEAYEQALGLDPTLADAHFNLSGVYEQLGEKTAAFRHPRTCRSLTGSGPPAGGSGDG